jgi:hypothetical protein
MIIRRETLNAALTATTADDTRYYLHAVLCEPAAHRVIATNGHVLLIATDRSPHADVDFPTVDGAEFHGDPDPICVSVDVIKSMLATMPKKSTIPILTAAQLGRNGSDDTAVLAATDLQARNVATIRRDEGQFPKYERMMLAPGPTTQLCLAVDVLETLIKAAKAVVAKGAKATVTFEIPNTKPGDGRTVTSAIGLTIAGEYVTVTGVAMPCRL